MKHLLFILASLMALCASAQTLETVNIGGTNRTMMVYAPKNIEQNRPLVISLHGANQDAAYQRDQTKWNNCADTANFVVVYPNAINKFWDTGGQSDIKFISSVIDMMADRYQIDRNRVYISGFSLGAMMTYHCIEHLGDKVAAFAPVSGVRFDNRAPISPRRVPIIHTHGTGDDVFKWVGDPGHMAGGYPYIPDYVESWATYEGLTEKTVISPYPSNKSYSIATLTTWSSPDPEDNIQVALLALKDKGHWHSEDLASGVSTTQEIWRFCKRYSLVPEPPAMVSIEPEDGSFDLTDATREFVITFDDLADISTISATLTCGDAVTTLDCQTAENSNTVNFKVPDNITLADGDYQLAVIGIKNPEGGREASLGFNYYYGVTEAGNMVKDGFNAVYARAVELYDLTAEVEALSVVSARIRLKKYIDKYVDFSSNAPSAYEKAINNLQKNMDILERYLESSSGITDACPDAEAAETLYYTIEGIRLDAPRSGLNIQVRRNASGQTDVQKVYR